MIKEDPENREEITDMEDITPEDSTVPVYLIPPTEEEVAEFIQLAVDEEARQAQAESERLAKKEALDRATAKLADLGLTEEEARAVIGL
jgi:hypothetical protein